MFITSLLAFAHVISGQVVFDGSTGAVGFPPGFAPPGPDYQLGPEFGTIAGPNIFYSFSEFNLALNESAFFDNVGEVTVTGIDRVISRVTGGNVSTINGLIESGYVGADFYFINPAGVVFGAEGEIAIDGSFYVSTADYLSLGNGGRFDASSPANTVLTSAPPIAFGFLNSNPGTLKVQDSFQALPGPVASSGPRLTVPRGTLAFVGGDISIASSIIQQGVAQPSGDFVQQGVEIVIASVASPGEVSIHPGGLAAIETSAGMLGGDFTLDFSRIQADAKEQSGMGVSIFAGDLFVDSSVMNPNTSGTGTPRGLDIDLTGTLTVRNSTLAATATRLAQADGGTFSVNANSVLVDGNSIMRAEALGAGNGGNLTMNIATDIRIDGAGLSAHTTGSGNGGDILLVAPTIHLLNGASISASSIGGLNSGGDGGSITLNADLIDVRSGSGISASSYSQPPNPNSLHMGAGGDIFLNVVDVIFDGEGSHISLESRAMGNGGNLEIVASGNVQFLSGAAIQASNLTTVSSEGSDVSIIASRIEFEGTPIPEDSPNAFPASNIMSMAGNAGNGGLLRLEADHIHFHSRGGITAPTTGTGNASTTHLIAHDSLTIEGQLSGIFSGAPGGEGRGPGRPPGAISGESGRIIVEAGDVILRDSAEFVSSTSVETDAGDIEIRADSLQINDGIIKSGSEEPDAGLSGRIIMELGTLTISSGGRIETNTSSDSNAGTILIAADQINVQEGGHITTNAGTRHRNAEVAAGSGEGGRLFLNAGSILIAGEVASNTEGGGGTAGRVLIGDLPADILSSDDPINIADLGLFTDPTAFVATYNALDLAQLSVIGTGEIASASSGAGNAREISIESQSILVDGGRIITSVVDRQEAPGEATGSARDASITINTGEFIMRNGLISSEAGAGAGDAGDVSITSMGQFQATDGTISTASAGTGKAGEIALSAASIETGARIRTTVVGIDNASRASISLISTSGDIRVTGGEISASSSGDAKAGVVSVHTARDFQLQDGSILSSGTGAGDAGTIDITSSRDFHQTRGEISSKSQGSGHAGRISILANGELSVNTGRIESSSSASGDAGRVDIQGENVSFRGAIISTAATGTGDASEAHVIIAAVHNFEMRAGSISTAAADPNQGAGEIYIAAGLPEHVNPVGNLSIRDAITRADSLGDGGNIYLFSPQIITITNSKIIASAGKDGGAISIGETRPTGGRMAIQISKPLFVILERSFINGVAGGRPVKVRINSGHFLNAQNTILTDAPPTFPDANIVEGLILFEPAPITVADLLENRCSVKLPGNISSFIIAGPGGIPIDSDWLLPGFVAP